MVNVEGSIPTHESDLYPVAQALDICSDLQIRPTGISLFQNINQ